MATTSFFHPLAAPMDRGGVCFRRCPFSLTIPARTAPRRPAPLLVVRAKRAGSQAPAAAASRQPANPSAVPKRDVEEEEEEVEEEMPWIQDKALDLVEFTGTVTQAIPGPRVGSSPVPWLLAVPLAYVGVSFVLAVVRTVRRFTSPHTKKKRRVSGSVMKILLRFHEWILMAYSRAAVFEYSVIFRRNCISPANYYIHFGTLVCRV